MGKNKLQRFQDNANFNNVIEPQRESVFDSFELKGEWSKKHFKNSNPIIIEVGCGGGEYTIALAERYPNINFIGIDIKGARIWKGAKLANEKKLSNVAFLRIQIELLQFVFSENEVSEIWITFPDPQIKFRRRKHRLTHPLFLNSYKHILSKEGKIHLKTDSEFLHGYTLGLLENSDAEIIYSNNNVYHESNHVLPPDVRDIQTFYEKRFIDEGKDITYIQFKMGSLFQTE